MTFRDLDLCLQTKGKRKPKTVSILEAILSLLAKDTKHRCLYPADASEVFIPRLFKVLNPSSMMANGTKSH